MNILKRIKMFLFRDIIEEIINDKLYDMCTTVVSDDMPDIINNLKVYIGELDDTNKKDYDSLKESINNYFQYLTNDDAFLTTLANKIKHPID